MSKIFDDKSKKLKSRDNSDDQVTEGDYDIEEFDEEADDLNRNNKRMQGNNPRNGHKLPNKKKSTTKGDGSDHSAKNSKGSKKTKKSTRSSDDDEDGDDSQVSLGLSRYHNLVWDDDGDNQGSSGHDNDGFSEQEEASEDQEEFIEDQDERLEKQRKHQVKPMLLNRHIQTHKKNKLKRHIDDDDEEEANIKRRKRKKDSGQSDFFDNELDGSVEVNIGFGNQSGGGDDKNNNKDEHDDSDYNNQKELEGEFAKTIDNTLNQATHALSNNQKIPKNTKQFFHFLADFSNNIEDLKAHHIDEYNTKKQMAEYVINEMFLSFIDGMDQFSKETKQHHIFGRGAKLTQEILRNLKHERLGNVKILLNKLILKKT